MSAVVAEPDVFDLWHMRYGQAAFEEGWSLFECDDLNHAPIEVQADCDSDVLDNNDGLAARLLVARAMEGSAMHADALAVLFLASQEEWRFVVALHRYDEYTYHGLPLDVQAWIQCAHDPIFDELDRWAWAEEIYSRPGEPGTYELSFTTAGPSRTTSVVFRPPFEPERQPTIYQRQPTIHLGQYRDRATALEFILSHPLTWKA